MLSRLDWPDDLFLGKGGGTFVIIGVKPAGKESLESMIPELRARVSQLTAQLRPQFPNVRMLGFTLTVAVFLDATIVRMVICPALLQLAGDWNWWPLGLAGSKRMPEPESMR